MPSLSGLPVAGLVDVAVSLTVLATAYFGLRAGFARGLWSLAGWIAPIMLALAFQKDTARTFAPFVNMFGTLSSVTNALAFAGLVLAAHFAFVMGGQLVVEPLISRVMRSRATLARVDRYLGPLPAMARVLVIAAGVLTAIASLPPVDDVMALMKASAVARPLVAATSSLQAAMARDIADREAAPLYDIGRALSSPDDVVMPPSSLGVPSAANAVATPPPSTVVVPTATPTATASPAPTAAPTLAPPAPTVAAVAPGAQPDPNAWRQTSPCALTTPGEIQQVLGVQTSAGTLENNPGEPGTFPPRLTCTFDSRTRGEAVIVFIEPSSSWANTLAGVMNYERFGGLGQDAIVKDGYVGSQYFVLAGARVVSVNGLCTGCDRSATLALTRRILARLP